MANIIHGKSNKVRGSFNVISMEAEFQQQLQILSLHGSKEPSMSNNIKSTRKKGRKTGKYFRNDRCTAKYILNIKNKNPHSSCKSILYDGKGIPIVLATSGRFRINQTNLFFR